MAEISNVNENLTKQWQENRTYFNEYIFYRCVRNRNSQRARRGEAPVSGSELNDLRTAFKEQLLDKLEANGMDVSEQRGWSSAKVLQKVNTSRCFEIMSKIFADEVTGREVFRTVPYENDPNAQIIINDFAKESGLKADASAGFNSLWHTFVSNSNKLPVSPFDPRFNDVIRSGESVTWVDVSSKFRKDNIVRLENNEDFMRSRIASYGSSDNRPQMQSDDVQQNNQQSQSLPNDGDILDPLRPYMTTAEYGNIRPYFDTDIRGRNITNIPNMDTAITMLDYFRNNGIEYSLQPDARNGQIKCKLTGTKIDIRLVDVSDLQNNSDMYVGRVYEDGVSYYYKDMKPRSKEDRKAFRPDAKQMIDLIRYVRGESVPRFDGQGFIGAPVSRNGNRSNGSYWTAKTSTVNGRTSSGFTAYAGTYNGIEFGIQKMGDETPSSVYDETTAKSYLEFAINSARNNFKTDLNIEQLVAMAELHKNDEDYEFPYSSDGQIGTLQREYYRLLTGKDTRLTHIDGTSFDETLSVEEVINQHADESVDDLIGEWSDTGTFNPANVGQYMSSEYGIYYNNDELVNALRIIDYPAERLKGANNNFYNKTFIDKLIKFDETSAKPMVNGSPFMRSMFDEIKTTLEETGCIIAKDSDILIDKNGVVQYTASQVVGVSRAKAANREIKGHIGQIFEPDGKGLVETKFAGRGDDNYLFVPGYEAYVIPNQEGENKTMEERTRLKGYEQVMREAIGHQLRRDIMMPANFDGMGSPTNINNAYSRLYVERFPLNYMDYMRNTAEQAALTDARIETLSRRVRYSNELRDGSTINAEYRASHGFNNGGNDSKRDPYVLTGVNMSLIGKTSDGYFDSMATSTSTSQGIVRYLVESAKVNSDGSITKGNEDDRTPLLKMPMCQYMTQYNAGDRVTMTFNNLLSALNVGQAKVACMSFGGFTFDDGYVISKKFAESRALPNADGVGRPLKKGDKISDLNGNKGVISFVVDPEMSDDEAKEQGIFEMVQWFRANPDLEVVGAPYAGVSRFNGGSAREAIANHEDLHAPEGVTITGGIGTMYFLTSNMVVDEKTHMYGLEEEMVGKGRKVSGQAGWILQSKGAKEIAKEFFGPNDRALMTTREMLIAMGLDINELGELQPNYVEHEGEKRNVFKLPKVTDTISEYNVKTKDGEALRTVHRRNRDKFNSREEFMKTIGRTGGIMEIPFPLKFPTGAITPPMNDNKTDIIYSKSEWERRGYTRKDGVYVKPTTVHRHIKNKTDTYGLPIMSATLRSGQEFGDEGISTVHDYTREYMRIWESSLNWQVMQYRIDNKEYDSAYPNDDALFKKQQELQNEAQSSYSVITNDLSRRKFEGKHNIARDELMARRLPKSATAVWTADPRLDLNEVAMSSKMAKELGVKPDGKSDEYVTIWRDPLLRDAGMRYLKVVIDDSLTGVAINPVIDKPFDGDFDGDTAAVVALQKDKSKKEAYQKFSMEANMLDFGSIDEKTGEYKLAYHIDGLDLAGPLSADKKLAEKQRAIQKKANEIYRDTTLSDAEKLHKNRMLLDIQSELTHEIFNKSYGKHVLSFEDVGSCVRSLATMVQDGAKGSMKKLDEYAKYFGAEIDFIEDKDGNKLIKTVKDLGKSGATRDDIIATQFATSVKALGTGVAGSFSQRAVVAFRNEAMKSALEVTYPVTQSVLQIKHDPAQAQTTYNLMMGPVRHLWRGHKLEEVHDPVDGNTWKPVKDGNDFVQATPEEFKQQFIDIYTKSYGLNVAINTECVDEITKVLTDETTGKIMSVEDTARDKYACTLDKLAYGGTFNTWVAIANNPDKKSLFDKDSLFAPSKIRHNQFVAEHGTDLGMTMTPIMKADVKDKSMKVVKSISSENRPVPDTSNVEHNVQGYDSEELNVG